MRLIDKDMKTGIQHTSYSFDLDGGLSKKARGLLRDEIVEILRSKGIIDITRLDVSLSIGILARSKESE